MFEYPLPTAVPLRIRLAGGLVEVTAETRDSAVIEVLPWDDNVSAQEAVDRTRVELTDDGLLIEAPNPGMGWLLGRSSRIRVRARVPLNCPLDVKIASADLRGTGTYGPVRISSASGDCQIGEVTGDLVVSTASGDIRVDRVAGGATVNSASGDIALGAVAGDVSAQSASGDIEVGRAGGSVKAHSASGDVTVGSTRQGTVKINTASGDVQVGVLQGTGVWLDLATLSGTTTSELAMGGSQANESAASLSVRVHTASGDIALRRVSAAAA